MKKKLLVSYFLLCASCGFFKNPPSNEPDLGAPSQPFTVSFEGDEMYKLINLPITSDTIKNLITQLGKHSYSTTRDVYDPYATSGMKLYYQFEGIRLVFNGPDAGTNKKQEVEKIIKAYPNDPFILEEIDIDPAKYRGRLPMDLRLGYGPATVQNILGVADSFFYSNNDVTSRFKFIYPNHGLQIQFNFFPGDVNPDSTMYLILVTDPLAEMKRFPTKFPHPLN